MVTPTDGAVQQHTRPACGHSGVALGNADCADLWIVPTSSWESSAEQTLWSARSAQSGRPRGLDTKWMALRVPAWGRNVMCQCVHPSPTTRRSGQQDGVLRAGPGLAAQLRRATRTGLCQRRRYESPCCAADDATRVGIIGRCGDVGKTPNLVRWRGPVFERRAIRWVRMSWEGAGPGAR